MSIKYGFFNSIDSDRKYDARDISSLFDGIINDGVFATLGNLFATTPGTGLQVIVDTGKAWFNRTWTVNDAKLPLNLETADITLDRYDAVVLEVNENQDVRANDIKIVKGGIGVSPEKPNLTNDEFVHQYPLAYVKVRHNSNSVLPEDIEICVGKEPCPFVTGILNVVPINSLFAQWEAEFDTWLESVKTQLEGDVAVNLQKQIELLKIATGSTITSGTATSLSISKECTVDKALSVIGSRAYNVGDIVVTARNSAPDGYILCNGDLVDPNEYPDADRAIDPHRCSWVTHAEKLPMVESDEDVSTNAYTAYGDGAFAYLSYNRSAIVLNYTRNFKDYTTKTIKSFTSIANQQLHQIYYNSVLRRWFIFYPVHVAGDTFDRSVAVMYSDNLADWTDVGVIFTSQGNNHNANFLDLAIAKDGSMHVLIQDFPNSNSAWVCRHIVSERGTSWSLLSDIDYGVNREFVFFSGYYYMIMTPSSRGKANIYRASSITGPYSVIKNGTTNSSKIALIENELYYSNGAEAGYTTDPDLRSESTTKPSGLTPTLTYATFPIRKSEELLLLITTLNGLVCQSGQNARNLTATETGSTPNINISGRVVYQVDSDTVICGLYRWRIWPTIPKISIGNAYSYMLLRKAVVE